MSYATVYKGKLMYVAFACLLLSLGGCSWTGRMLGMGSDKPAAEQKTEPAASAPAAPAEATAPSTGRVSAPPSIDLGISTPVSAAPAPQTTAAKDAAASQVPVQPPANEPLEKAVPLPPRTSPTAPVGQQPSATDPSKPLTQIGAKGAVLRENGDLEYFNVPNIQTAIKAAMEKDTFLGYTDPFHAFPVFSGNDTVSGAFVPADHPQHKVFFHTFYLPERPFNKRIYGYTVIDMRTNADFGHFDGDGDGVFEQRTLEPKIVIDSFQNQPPNPAFLAPPITPAKAKAPSIPASSSSGPYTGTTNPAVISPTPKRK